MPPPTDDDEALTESTVAASEGAASAFVIDVIEGPTAGARLTLDGSGQRVLVGQSSVCDLRLADPRVSRRHIAAEAFSDHVRVTDLGSTNGTFLVGVGEVRVLDLMVRGGERLRIGDSVLAIERRRPDSPPPPTSRAPRFGRMVGQSATMRALYPLCDRLASSMVSVLIEGETGTGKEILAEAIHESGPRAKKPFIVFDCTAIAPTLIESELFGHERGAFTGAVSTRAGLFEQADGGTLLIDEIGELDASLQPKLLRALERSEFRRVGGQRPIKVDVRVLSATRRDLDREVQQGRFRDDLFHRLAVTRIELPPLRRRRGDVALLARTFADHLGAPAAGIPYEQMLRWEDHAWPGNVRELRNAVAQYLALGDLAPALTARPFAPLTSTFDPLFTLPIAAARQRLVDEFERAYVAHVLAEHGGDIERAAAASGLARRQFFRLKAKASGD